jgi:hypothetical protein
MRFDGRTFGPASSAADVKWSNVFSEIRKDRIRLDVDTPRMVILAKRTRYEFPFAGARLQRIHESRSAGKAASGAIAGALLLGPLGAIAGAAIGGKKQNVLSLHCGENALLFETGSSDLKELISRGLLTPP